MAMWQKIAVLLTGLIAVGGVTYFSLFGGLFQLDGVNATYSGDIECGFDCESYINVTTKTWTVCFEHPSSSQKILYPNKAGTLNQTTIGETNAVLYKKSRTGTNLWVNLNNVSNIVSTNPYIQVDWLVPTTGGKWRPIKDGDCWNTGKINQIKLVGHKNLTQTVKWSFNLTAKGEGVSIDPTWKGITFLYTVRDTTYNGQPAKQIVLNLTQDYNLSTLKGTYNKPESFFLNRTLTKVFGNADIQLYEKIIELKQVPSYYTCNCTNITVTTDAYGNPIPPYQTTICQHCINQTWTNVTTYKEINLSNLTGFVLRRNATIIEVPSVQRLIKLPNGKWGYSVYSEINILGENIPNMTWWNTSWSYRFCTNLSNVNDTKTNYPFLFRINTTATTGTNFSYSNVTDLKVTDESGNVYTFWIEKNDSTNSIVYTYILMNLTSGTNNTICTYYGNPTATSASNLAGTMTGNLQIIYDYLGNAYDPIQGTTPVATATPTLTAERGGNLSEAYEFIASEWDGWNASDSTVWDTQTYSITMWAKSNRTTAQSSFGKWWDGAQRQNVVQFNRNAAFGDAAGNIVFARGITNSYRNVACVVSNGKLSDNKYHYYAFTTNSTNMTIYVDGVLCGTATGTTASIYNSAQFVVGQPAYTLTSRDTPFNGSIYGVRFYNTTLTDAGVLGLYISIEPTITFGIEEYPTTPTSFTVTPNSPTNNSYTNDTTPDFKFTPSGTNSSYNCTLYINTTANGTATIENNTEGTITSNATLGQYLYLWNVTCTNGTTHNATVPRNLTIDSISPNSTSSSPASNSYTNNGTLDINFTLTEANINSTNCSITNSSGSIVNSTSNTSIGEVHCYLSVYINGLYNISLTHLDKAGNTNVTRIDNVTLWDCFDITTAGTYELTRNLTSDRIRCISINASNVTLDCKGYTLTDTGYSDVIGFIGSNNVRNITVNNCNIIGSGGADAISYDDNTVNNIVINNTNISYSPIDTTAVAILLDGDNITIDNLIVINISMGVLIQGVNTIINNSKFYNFTRFGIYVDEENNTIENSYFNTLVYNGDYNIHGIEVYGGNGKIRNNTLLNGQYSLYIRGDYEIYDNLVQTGNTECMYIHSTSDNSKIYNNLFNCTDTIVNAGEVFGNVFNTTLQSGTRIFSAGTQIGGNYWTNSSGDGYSDTCTDADTDGFCDSSLNLTTMTSCSGTGCNANYTDYLPLSNKYSEACTLTCPATANLLIQCSNACNFTACNMARYNVTLNGTGTVRGALVNLTNASYRFVTNGCYAVN